MVTVDTSSISIAWNASSDNVGVTGYDIYRNGALLRSQPGTSYTDTSLAVYTGYTYTIAARDAANNGSSLSAPLNAFTSPKYYRWRHRRSPYRYSYC